MNVWSHAFRMGGRSALIIIIVYVWVWIWNSLRLYYHRVILRQEANSSFIFRHALFNTKSYLKGSSAYCIWQDKNRILSSKATESSIELFPIFRKIANNTSCPIHSKSLRAPQQYFGTSVKETLVSCSSRLHYSSCPHTQWGKLIVVSLTRNYKIFKWSKLSHLKKENILLIFLNALNDQ